MKIVGRVAGVKLMRQWGVLDWTDPGAEYVVWDNCCIFALVQQEGFVDIHMAMDPLRHRECRQAGAEILKLVGHHPLRAIILTDRIKVCNYAARMGFGRRTKETLQTIDGRESAFFIMWREPGEYHGRCN